MTGAPIDAAARAVTPRKRRGWLVYLGASLVVVSVLLALAVFAMIAEQWPPKDGATLFADWFFVGAVAMPLGLGFLLMNRGEPGIVRRLWENVKAWPKRAFDSVRTPLALRATLLRLGRTSLAIGALTLGVSLVLMYAFRPAATLIALGTLTLYSVVDPLLLVERRSWWLGALISIVVWLPVFSLVADVADKLNNLRESSMVFFLPFMVFPGAIAVSGFLRLFLRTSRRPTAETPRP